MEMIYEYNTNVSGIDNQMKMLMGTKIYQKSYKTQQMEMKMKYIILKWESNEITNWNDDDA